MTLSYSVGLTTGSIIAYLIQHWLDSQNQGYRGSCDNMNAANQTSLTNTTTETSLTTALLPIVTTILPTILPKSNSVTTATTATVSSVMNAPTVKVIATTIVNLLQNSSLTTAESPTVQSELAQSTARIKTPFLGTTMATGLYLNRSIAGIATDIVANMTSANTTTTSTPESFDLP